MKKRVLILLSFLLVGIGVLAGCGFRGIEEYIQENYLLVDVLQSDVDSNGVSKIYRAENQDLSQVANELSEAVNPEEIGQQVEGKQVLVYDESFVFLSEDPEQAGDTLIEVSTTEFVRHHYSPGFFQGMLLGNMLSNMFGNDWERSQRNRCIQQGRDDCYRGYSSSGGGGYYGGGSIGRGSTFRGGGPGSGK
ncbi:MAG TPA: DUF4247 domain-containing protein [Chondromyces sp.]|nr:DUF4247 domain-containing protein [Chondromyces sp.]